jgi:hypothetical protein
MLVSHVVFGYPDCIVPHYTVVTSSLTLDVSFTAEVLLRVTHSG